MEGVGVGEGRENRNIKVNGLPLLGILNIWGGAEGVGGEG